ncbi:carbohydrate kinase family protein [Georgenia sp. MJ170]|uniref:carbohydrate kinase family protein n=2 Tax=Georgenia sunbinii TaxID=3117728 RepID=UPI002F260168
MTAGSSTGSTSAVLVVGEALIDIVERADAPPAEHVGGSPANVAVGLARLGHPVELTTWFGSDARGHRIREHLVSAAVDVTSGSELAERTPTARARLDATGAASYTFDLHFDLPATSPLRAPALVHVGSISATIEPGGSKVADLARRLRATATVSYDPNARPAIMGPAPEARRTIEGVVALADVVKVSDEDIAWLAPDTGVLDVARDWLALGPAVVVVTRGGDGATALTATGHEVTVAAPRVTVADTVGAGDSFMAGIIDGLSRAGLVGAAQRDRLRRVSPDQLREVLARAATIAAITVSRAGANPPTAAEVATSSLDA